MLHVAKLDLERIRTRGWPLPHSVTEHQINLTLPSPGREGEQRDAFLFRLYALGFTKSFADLIGWACKADRQYLLLDDRVEPSDRLLIFVG